LIAPPGFGKTTALVNYLRHSTAKSGYCSIAGGASAHGIWAAIARGMHMKGTPSSHEELIRALAKAAPLELALDCEGLPDAGGIAAITRLIDEAPEGVSLLVACRSRAALGVSRLVTRGIASLCDAERLRFDEREIAHLASTFGVPFDHADIPRLLDVTDGWPALVNFVLRRAVEDGCDLAGAFENWRTRYGSVFDEFVTTALNDASDEEAALVRRLMNGFHCEDKELLRRLECEGLFVVHFENEYRPLRGLSATKARHVLRASSPDPLHVRMLGWFRAEIKGRPIKWIRHRDQQIFKYVALKSNGRASRAELSELFWPGGEKELVSQCLRTAFSNIRKAIANLVGFDSVSAYFNVNGDASVDLNNVIVDLHKLTAYLNDGDEEYERGELQVAYAHYRRAAELYRGDLLIADAKEPWVAAHAAVLERRHRAARERILESRPDLAARVAFESRAHLSAG
jgi:hypothetical protein